MPFFNVNHKNLSNAFIFNALYSSILFGVMFITNDYIDNYIIIHLEEDYHIYLQKTTKLLLHVLSTFIFTLFIVYLLWWIFGWGKSLREF